MYTVYLILYSFQFGLNALQRCFNMRGKLAKHFQQLITPAAMACWASWFLVVRLCLYICRPYYYVICVVFRSRNILYIRITVWCQIIKWITIIRWWLSCCWWNQKSVCGGGDPTFIVKSSLNLFAAFFFIGSLGLLGVCLFWGAGVCCGCLFNNVSNFLASPKDWAVATTTASYLASAYLATHSEPSLRVIGEGSTISFTETAHNWLSSINFTMKYGGAVEASTAWRTAWRSVAISFKVWIIIYSCMLN